MLEYCSGGELFDRLKSQDGDRFTEPVAALLVWQILSSVAYCHRMGISHRDLKLENFLFENPRPDAALKLIDFGLSRKYASGRGILRMKSTVGTPVRTLDPATHAEGLDLHRHLTTGDDCGQYYIAPEVLLAKETRSAYTEKCDIWSIGVIAYMLVSGRAPFKGRDDKEIVESVRRGKYTLSSKHWDGVSELAKDFVRRCLRYNPEKRPSAEELLTGAFAVQSLHPEYRIQSLNEG